MSTQDWAVFLITAAAIPATFGLLIYAFTAPWYRTAFGRAYVIDGLSVAVLLDLALVIHWTHWVPPEWLVLWLYGLIAVGQWMQAGAVVHYQIQKRRDGESS